MAYKYLFALLVFLIWSNYTEGQLFNAEVLKYSTTCVADENELVKIDSVIIQINNRIGDEYSFISIPYSKSNKVSDLVARIETPFGVVVRELKKSDIVDKSAISDFSLYEDDYIKTFQLKHNTYPYKIFYTFKTTQRRFLNIASWTPILIPDIPTRLATLKIDVPKSYQIKKNSKNIVDPNIVDNGSTISYFWSASSKKVSPPEIFSDPGFEIPFVAVVPLFFNYGLEGSFESWSSYGNWQYRLNEGLDILPEYEANMVKSIVSKSKDKMSTIKHLYHYLQDQTRYVNVTVGVGGFQSYPAAYVAENKYGDCKALSNYMKTLLAYAGIESFYTNVYASEQPVELRREFPSPQFNHIILAVPIDNDTIWIDNTSKTNPLGYQGTFNQNREALIISQEQSRLVKVPALTSSQNEDISRIEFDLVINGPVLVTVCNRYKGRSFEWFTEINTNYNNDQRNQIIREYLPFENYEVVNWDLKRVDRDSAQINLNASLFLNKIVRSLGKEYYVGLNPTRLPLFESPANRYRPLSIPYPISSIDTLIYSIPEGFVLKKPLDPVLIVSKYGRFSRNSKMINGKITFIKSLQITANNYPQSDYTEFYNFIKAIKDCDRSPIILTPITTTY